MTQRRDELSISGVRERLGELMLKGSVVTLVAQLLKGLIQIASTLVLARLLDPTDYGLFGLTAVVLNLISMFQDAGLSTATIQRDDLTDAQVNTLFWLNAGLSALLALALTGLAPALAWFYEEPRLTPLLWVMNAALLINGVRLQHRAIMRRRMQFGHVAGSDLTAALVGTVAGVAFGLMGWGYWALAGMQIVSALVATVTTWRWCAWRPGRPHVDEEARELIDFGKNLTGYNFVNYFARNADDYLIFYAHGAAPLGLYGKAYELLRMPLRYINTPLSAVAVPALSRLADEPEEYRRLFLRVLEKIAMLALPLGAFMILNAADLIVVLLGQKWSEAGEIFRWLGLLVFIQPVANATGWLFITQDRTEEMLRWGIAGSVMAVLAILAGLPWGASGVAMAYATSGLALRAPILFWYVGRDGPIRARDFYSALGRFAIPTAASVGAMWLIREELTAALPLARVLVAFAVGLAVLMAMMWITPGSRAALRDVSALIQQARDAASRAMNRGGQTSEEEE